MASLTYSLWAFSKCYSYISISVLKKEREKIFQWKQRMTQNDSEINMQQIALEVVLPFKFPPKKKKKKHPWPCVPLCLSSFNLFLYKRLTAPWPFLSFLPSDSSYLPLTPGMLWGNSVIAKTKGYLMTAYLTFHAVDQPFLEMLPFFIAPGFLFPSSFGLWQLKCCLLLCPH